MRKFSHIFLIILIFGVFLVFPVFAQEEAWTKARLQEMYMRILREEGYLPSIDERDVRGDIIFKVSGRSYYILIDVDDIKFFRIYRGVSLGDYSLQTALETANDLNRRSKVAKVYISERGSVAINIELLLSNPSDFKPLLDRALNLMSFTENNFFNLLREAAANEGAP